MLTLGLCDWPVMRKRPNYGNATPEDLARALLRPVRWRSLRASAGRKPVVRNQVCVQEPLADQPGDQRRHLSKRP